MLEFGELKSLDCFKNLVYLNREYGQSNIIRWPYVTETVEFHQWTHGEELLIVTSAVTGKSDYSLRRVIEEAVKSKLSGAVLLVGNDYINKAEITKSIIQYASENDFPLAEISWEVPLVDILEEVSKAVIDKIKMVNCEEDCLFQRLSKNYQAEIYGEVPPKYRIAMVECESSKIMELRGCIEKYLQNYKKENYEITVIESKIIILIEQIEECDEIEKELLDIIKAGNNFENRNLFITMSEIKTRSQDLNEAMDECKELNNIFHYFNLKGQAIRDEDSSLYKIIYYSRDKELLKESAKKILEPINNYDSMNKTDLFETIKMCVDCDFNLIEASKKLFIHRNTMHYRIRQIEKVLNRDWNNHMFRYDVQYSIFIQKLLENV